ncbi:hypothetical protein ACFL96_03755 [Thermoproteota archaeon]
MAKQPKPQPQITRNQVQSLLPGIKEFNSVAKVFSGLLSQKIEYKEKRLSRISILISDVLIPERENKIDITTVDMRKTKVRKKGQGAFNQTMKWEDDYYKRKRGVIL